MKTMKLIPILFLCLVSCNKGTHSNDYPTYSLEDLSAINLQMSLPLDSFVSEMNVIPLETQDYSLIDNVDLLRESENYLFVYSEKNGSLYRFDKKGKYLGKIGTRGQGPEEFIGIKQIELDNGQQEIYVMDYQGRKMKIYSFEGKFLRAFPLPENLAYTNFTLIPEQKTIYYVSSQNSICPDVLEYEIPTGKFTQLSKHEREMGMGEFFFGQTFFAETNSSLYMYHYYNDTVYQIKDNKLTPDHLLVLGERIISWKDMGPEILTNPKPMRKKIQINKMASLKDYICIFYSVTRYYEGTLRKDLMCIYKPGENSFYPHVNLTSQHFLSIANGCQFDTGFQGESILCAILPQYLDEDILQKYHIDEEDNPVIIQYILK